MISTHPTPIPCVLYARKSSEQEDRQILSIDSQIRELHEYAARTSLVVAEVLVEAASAKSPGRPIFNELVARIGRGRVKTILAWHPDRLSRNALDAARLIDLMDRELLHEIHTPSQVFRATPSDKFFLTFHWGQAKLENDNKSVNVKRGLTEKARRGARPSPAPVGYLNDPLKPKGQKVIFLDPERGPFVRRMFEAVLQGVPPREVLRRMNEDWGFRTRAGRPLSRSAFYRLLTRPFYAGKFEYPQGSGTWHEGSHPAIISVAEFERVQLLLRQQGRPRSQEVLRFRYTGLFTCGECGAAITAEEKHKLLRDGTRRRYVYYHCTKRVNPACTQRSIEEQALDQEIVSILAGLSTTEAFADWGRECVKLLAAQERIGTKESIIQLRRTIRSAENRLDGLVDMRAAGEISSERFTQKRDKVEGELASLRQHLVRAEAEPPIWSDWDGQVRDLAKDATARFESGSPEVKAEIIRRLSGNRVLHEKQLGMAVDPVFRAADATVGV